MARMIPESVAEETESAAERRFFERLRDDTPDELVAFHHVAWLVPGRKGRPLQGEADFVVADPERGALVIEVKGGSIAHDAATGAWTTTGRHGTAEIKNPFEQADNASHRLRDVLGRAKRGGDEQFTVRHAVAFPDARVSENLGPAAPRELIVDAKDLTNLSERLTGALEWWNRGQDATAPGEDGIRSVEQVLAKSFELPAPLVYELRETERELMRLTEEQHRILDLLARHPRAAISGCAGSGKTFLAAEKARRLAAQGFRVLVLCFNKLLAEHLEHGLSDVDAVDVSTFDGLCWELTQEAGVELPESPEPGKEGEYYTTLRAEFANCADRAAGRYSALIVDEAQDFSTDWWLPLQLLLEDPDESPLYVFYDDNQKIFAVPDGLPIEGETHFLPVNCRNTQTIHRLVASYYEGDTIEALGPQGLPIQTTFYSSPSDLLEKLDGAVSHLLRDAEVPPHEIALLTPRSMARSALGTLDRIGGAMISDDPWQRNRLLRSSIHRFKGLERQVVVMLELDGARSDVLYVGFSRAKTFLWVLWPEAARNQIPSELRPG